MFYIEFVVSIFCGVHVIAGYLEKKFICGEIIVFLLSSLLIWEKTKRRGTTSGESSISMSKGPMGIWGSEEVEMWMSGMFCLPGDCVDLGNVNNEMQSQVVEGVRW